MKAISLWNPWAMLVAIGAKQYETRSWATSHRGLLAIHAAKHLTKEEIKLCFAEPFRYTLSSAGITVPTAMPYGMIIAVCELTAVYDAAKLRPKLGDGVETHFGNFAAGRYAWRLENVQLITPVAVKGQQGMWEWDQAFDLEKVRSEIA